MWRGMEVPIVSKAVFPPQQGPSPLPASSASAVSPDPHAFVDLTPVLLRDHCMTFKMEKVLESILFV